MAEPQDITRNPDDSVVPLTWSEAGVATEPSAGKKDTGWVGADVVDEATINWLDREPMRWLRALFSRYPQASEGLFSSWLVRNGVWADTGINPLEGFLSDAGLVDSKVADVWVDPAATGAARVQVRVSKGTPFTFVANRDTYVFVPTDLVTPPTATLADLTFTDVPSGDPAPATPVGTVGVWRVRTDGASIIDQEILVPTTPVLSTIGVLALSVLGDLAVTGNLDVGGDADVVGNIDVGGDVGITGDLLVPGVFTASTTLGVVEASVLFSAKGAVQLGDSPADTISMLGTTTFTVGSPTAGTCTWGATTSVVASMAVVGASGGSLSSDPTASLTWNGPATFNGTLTLPSLGGATGRIWRDGSDFLKYRRSTNDKFVHASAAGHRRGHNSLTTLGAPAASASITTLNAFAPPTTTNVAVRGMAYVSRAIAGPVELSLLDSVSGTIGSVFNVAVGTSPTLVFLPRTLSADTSPRTYTFNIDGLGQNVTVVQAEVIAETAEDLG